MPSFASGRQTASAAYHVAILIWPAIAVKLPDVAHLAVLLEVEVGHQHLFLFVAGLGDDLAARVDEVAGAVEVVFAERLHADAVDRADPVAVGDGMRHLLDLPEVHREPARGRRGDVDDLGAVEGQGAGALGEVPVVADVDADLGVFGLEDGVAQVAGPEVELLPEAGDLWDVRLAILAEVTAIGVDDGGGVVVDAGLLQLIYRHDQHHLVLLGHLAHAANRRAIGHRLGELVELGILHLAEVGAGGELLQAGDLHPALRRLADEADLPLDVLLHTHAAERLNQCAANHCHSMPPVPVPDHLAHDTRLKTPTRWAGCKTRGDRSPCDTHRAPITSGMTAWRARRASPAPAQACENCSAVRQPARRAGNGEAREPVHRGVRIS